MKPPEPSASEDLSSDDWSGLAAISAPRRLASKDTTASDDPNGGLRREPELPMHVEVTPQQKPWVNEFDFVEASEADDDAARSERLRSRMTANARQASLDPGDGIEL